MKRKPGLGEAVKVKKKVAGMLCIAKDARVGVVVDTNVSVQGLDVVVEMTTRTGVKFDIPMKLKELKGHG